MKIQATISILVTLATTFVGWGWPSMPEWFQWLSRVIAVGSFIFLLIILFRRWLKRPIRGIAYYTLSIAEENIKQLRSLVEIAKDQEENPKNYVFPYIKTINAYAALLSGENYILVDVYFPSALASEVELSQVSGKLFINGMPLKLNPQSMKILRYGTQQTQWEVGLTQQALELIKKANETESKMSIGFIMELEDMTNKKYHWSTQQFSTVLKY